MKNVTMTGGGVFTQCLNAFVKRVVNMLFMVHVASKLTCWLKSTLWKILL